MTTKPAAAPLPEHVIHRVAQVFARAALRIEAEAQHRPVDRTEASR
jgi:hypothetical protein